MNRLRAKVKGRGSARKPPSGRNRFFGRLKADVTAEAVTYKAKAESKSAGKSACATGAKIGAGRVSLRLC